MSPGVDQGSRVKARGQETIMHLPSRLYRFINMFTNTGIGTWTGAMVQWLQWLRNAVEPESVLKWGL